MKKLMKCIVAMGIAVGMVLSTFGEPCIETDGSQYVNTGYFVNPKTKVEMDYALLDPTRAQQRMFGTGGTDIGGDPGGKVYLIRYVNGDLVMELLPHREEATYCLKDTVTGVGEQNRKGLVLPISVTDAQRPNQLARWAVYVDGDRDDSLSAYVRNAAVVLDGRQWLASIIK